MLKVLTLGRLNDTEGDRALTLLPTLPDNVLVVVRNLQAQITELAARVEVLEGP